MRLRIDFSELTAALERMRVKPLDEFLFDPRDDLNLDLDLKLKDGIELLDLEEVETTNGLLSFKGRQVLLYIQDHGARVLQALENGKVGNRFHVSDCKTLHDMRNKNRFQRYVITKSLDGNFSITGQNWLTQENIGGTTRLWVCQNCLTKLSYKGATHGASYVVAHDFEIEEFFATYSSFFPHIPDRLAGRAEDEQYTKDWPNISAQYKANKDFKCENESCGVNLRSQKHLLHVHHRDGVKSNNRPENLEALCLACHRNKPFHKRMFIRHSDMKTIGRLRREQGLLRKSNWEKAIDKCDPALRGLFEASQKRNAPVPEVYWEIEGRRGEPPVAVLEAAWPQSKVGVSISEEDIKNATEAGWQVYTMSDALDNINIFVQKIATRF